MVTDTVSLDYRGPKLPNFIVYLLGAFFILVNRILVHPLRKEVQLLQQALLKGSRLQASAWRSSSV